MNSTADDNIGTLHYENRTPILGPERGVTKWAVYGDKLATSDGRRMYSLTVTEVLRANGNRAGWRATGTDHTGTLYAFSVGKTRRDAVAGLLSRGVAIDR